MKLLEFHIQRFFLPDCYKINTLLVIINLILKRRFIQGGFILHHLCWSQALIPSMFHEHNLFNRAYQIHGCVLTLNIMGLWKLRVSQSFLNSHSHRCKQIFLIQGLSYSGHCES